jgi:hypothetical protein
MIIPVFENDVVSCSLDDGLPVLRHHWKQAPSGEEFKNNLLRILEEFKTLRMSHSTLAWLADTRLLGELDEEIEYWLVNTWEELLFSEGTVSVHAVVLGENIFADYPMEKFKMDAETKFKKFNVHLGVFSNIEDAYKWIREQLIS